MGDYSLEPPRRDCIVHHTFDDVELNRVRDYSPQRIDGAVVGDVTFGHTGVVGQAARMAADDDHVKITGLNSFLPLSEMTAATWGRSERTVTATDNNIIAVVNVAGTEYTLTHSADEDVDGWQFAALRHDNATLELLYGTVDSDIRVVETVDARGDVTDFDVTVYTDGFGYVDDVRVYRTDLERSSIRDIHAIGATQTATDDVADNWDNDGIPFTQTNEQFGGALAEEKASVRRQLDFIREARHIEDADGEQLDRIGKLGGVKRREGESDVLYRARITGTLAAGRSSGTFRDILKATSAIVEVPTDRIEIQYQETATALIYLRTADVEESVLTISDIRSLLGDVVISGHAVEVVQQGATPFTVVNASMANDSDKGLTSDSISTGGGLVSDV